MPEDGDHAFATKGDRRVLILPSAATLDEALPLIQRYAEQRSTT